MRWGTCRLAPPIADRWWAGGHGRYNRTHVYSPYMRVGLSHWSRISKPARSSIYVVKPDTAEGTMEERRDVEIHVRPDGSADGAEAGVDPIVSCRGYVAAGSRPRPS